MDNSKIKISEIVIDENIYPRSEVDTETVTRYREALESGIKLPPLVVTSDGHLLDGRHRVEAHQELGIETAEVIVENPADPDARAVELNLRHGRPLTRAELKEVARRWYGGKPVTEIAGLLGVTRRTVQNWVADLAAKREETQSEIREKALEMRASGMTQEDVAESLGIERTTISKWENKPCESVKNFSPSHKNNPKTGYLDNSGHEIFTSFDEPVAESESIFERTAVSNEISVDDRYEDGQALDDEYDQESELSEEENFQSETPVRNEYETDSSELETGKKEDLNTEDPAYIDPHGNDDKPLNDYGGREAAEEFRKKHVQYSDLVKEFYYQFRKVSGLAEQLNNDHKKLYESLSTTEDGVNIVLLADTVTKMSDIYISRITQAVDMLEKLIKPGIKGVVQKEKFKVLQGGK